MTISINNIKEIQDTNKLSVIKRQRVIGNNTVPKYRLCKGLIITLSNGRTVTINEGFEWDLSSVPRVLWSFLPPDSDSELAALIHDYLYIEEKRWGRKFADKEMLLWSKVVSGTNSKWSIRNFDNQLRYIAVRAFGWIVWRK